MSTFVHTKQQNEHIGCMKWGELQLSGSGESHRVHCVLQFLNYFGIVSCTLRLTIATFISSKALFHVWLNHECHTHRIDCFEEHIAVFHDDTASYSKPVNEARAVFCHMEGNKLVSLCSEKVTASLAALPPHEFPFHCMFFL